MSTSQPLRHNYGPLLVSLLVSLLVLLPIESLPINVDFVESSNDNSPAGSLIGLAYRGTPPSQLEVQHNGYPRGTAGNIGNNNEEQLVPAATLNEKGKPRKQNNEVSADNEIDISEHGNRRKRTLSINSDIALLSSGFRRALKSNWAEYWIKQLEKQKIKKRSIERFNKRTLSINSDIKVLSAGFRRALKMNALREQLRMLMNE